jgi:hypothetical protein
MLEDDRPPDSIDPDWIPGRLTLIEERLKAMSIELDSLKAMSIGDDSLRTTSRRRHRSTTKRSNSVVILGLAVHRPGFAGLRGPLGLSYAAMAGCSGMA